MFIKHLASSVIFAGISLQLSASLFSHVSDSLRIEISPFDLRIHYPSTGVQFYRDGIIYLFDSKVTRESRGGYAPFGSLSMYYSPVKNNKLEKQIYFLRRDPFPYPADAVSFTADYSKMFFNHESRFRGYRDAAVRIYSADIRMLNNGKSEYTKRPSELPFNSKMYSCVQPAVSPDGKFLVFASDMPGGQGGLDLYYSIFRDGTWEDPINLGKEINTDLDECFPFIDRNGNLYFSSNGYDGYGKNDIYFSSLIKAYHWGKPVNTGPVLNSDKDDVAFTLSRTNESEGFFSSDRNLSGKQYQVFKIKIYGNIKSAGGEAVSSESESKKQVNEEKEPKEITQGTSDQLKTNDKTTDKPTEKVITEETPKTVAEQVKPEQTQPEIIFRIQFKASAKSLGAFSVTVNGKQYKTYEYFYKGAYRYTIGEFKTLDEALKLNQECKKKDYPDSFVVAFRGSERVLDPQVFKQ